MAGLNETIEYLRKEIEGESSEKYIILYGDEAKSVVNYLERLKELRLKYRNLKAKIRRFLKKYMVNYMGDKPWEF